MGLKLFYTGLALELLFAPLAPAFHQIGIQVGVQMIGALFAFVGLILIWFDR